MSELAAARSLQRQKQTELCLKLHRALVRAAAPVLLIIYCAQLLIDPRWQNALMTASMTVTCGLWLYSLRRLRQGELERAIAVTSIALIVNSFFPLILLRDNLLAPTLTMVAIAVIGGLFLRRLLFYSFALMMVQLAVAVTVLHFARVPQIVNPPAMHLGYQLAHVALIIPLILFMLRKGEGIDEIPFRELERTRSAAVLEAISRLQPEIDALVGQVDQLSSNLAAQAQEQAAIVAQVGQAMVELEQTLRSSANAAHETHDLAASTRQRSLAGSESLGAVEHELSAYLQTVAGVRQAIEALAQQSRNAEAIIGYIRDVDEAVHVLAINAGIEAANAGEAGRGFAVVASELRGMIGGTAENVRRSRELLARMQQQAQATAGEIHRGAEVLEGHLTRLHDTGQLVRQAAEAFSETSQKVELIARGADQQQQQVHLVSEAMGSLRESTATLSQSAGSLSDQMRRIAKGHESLKQLVEQFRA